MSTTGTLPTAKRSRFDVGAVALGGVLFGGVVLLWLIAWCVDGLMIGRDLTARGLEIDVPAGIDVETNVGRLGLDELRSRVLRVEDEYAAAKAEVEVDGELLEIALPAIGVTLDVQGTIDDIAAAGGAAPWSWTRRLFASDSVPPRFVFDEEVAETTLNEAVPDAGSPVEPQMVLIDGEFALQQGIPGQRFDTAGALAELAGDIGNNAPAVSIKAISVPPSVTDDAMQSFIAEANRLTANDFVVSVQDQVTTIDSAVVRSWLEVEIADDRPALSVNEASVFDVVRSRFEDVRADGTDASFDIVDNEPVIIDSIPGTRCCAENSGERIRTAVLAGRRRVSLDMENVGREKDTQWARDLGIVELVGEFKTFYTDGQSRVTNIKRIAELTRGVIIMPGDTWSVNDYVGRRTREKGFVAAGAIERGVLVQDVGGGISQYATTTMNAAFFAGLDIPDYRAHSIYFSRYPYGREATLAYGAIDLKLRNNSDNAVLLWPTTDSAGIRVQLFGTRYSEGAQTGQSSWRVGSSCTKVVTERTRTYVDNREPIIDQFEALYRPEGLLCNGKPSNPD